MRAGRALYRRRPCSRGRARAVRYRGSPRVVPVTCTFHRTNAGVGCSRRAHPAVTVTRMAASVMAGPAPANHEEGADAERQPNPVLRKPFHDFSPIP